MSDIYFASTSLDAFLIDNMSDDQIVELVKHQLRLEHAKQIESLNTFKKSMDIETNQYIFRSEIAILTVDEYKELKEKELLLKQILNYKETNQNEYFPNSNPKRNSTT